MTEQNQGQVPLMYEIWCEIIPNLDFDDLKSAAATCVLFEQIAAPLLWKYPRFRKNYNVNAIPRGHYIPQAALNNLRRAGLIRILPINLSFTGLIDFKDCSFFKSFSTPNLQNLV
jgi:hypothetical protein